MKTLDQLTQEIVAVYKEYAKQGTLDWDYRATTTDLSYQVGSLAKVVMQMQNLRYRDGLSDEELKKKAGDELADILAEVLIIANDLGIDMNQAWNNMIQSDQNKISERSSG